MKINDYSYSIKNSYSNSKQWSVLSNTQKFKYSINELLLFHSKKDNYDSQSIEEIIKDSDFEDEFLNLKYALKTKNPDYILDVLFKIEFQFDKYLENENDFDLFYSIMMNFFKNEWWNEFFLKNRAFQNNSITNYLYIKTCHIDEAIRYYKWNKLPLQSKYMLYERLIKNNDYKKYTSIILELKEDLNKKISQIDFLYSSFNRSVSEKLKALNYEYSNRITEIINSSKILKKEEEQLKIKIINDSNFLSWKDFQEIFSYKCEYRFLKKTFNILLKWDFEIIKSLYKNNIKRYYFNASKFVYNYIFFYYFEIYLKNLLEKDSVSNDDKILIEKEYLFWNNHYKTRMEKNFSKNELDNIILKSKDYLKNF